MLFIWEAVVDLMCIGRKGWVKLVLNFCYLDLKFCNKVKPFLSFHLVCNKFYNGIWNCCLVQLVDEAVDVYGVESFAKLQDNYGAQWRLLIEALYCLFW